MKGEGRIDVVRIATRGLLADTCGDIAGAGRSTCQILAGGCITKVVSVFKYGAKGSPASAGGMPLRSRRVSRHWAINGLLDSHTKVVKASLLPVTVLVPATRKGKLR